MFTIKTNLELGQPYVNSGWGGYRGEKEEEALCVKGMRLGGSSLFTAAANFGLQNFYLDVGICVTSVPL
jgi:hypothetical protein